MRLSYPIILSAGGAVMDGMHRVVKAARKGSVPSTLFSLTSIRNRITWASDPTNYRTEVVAYARWFPKNKPYPSRSLITNPLRPSPSLSVNGTEKTTPRDANSAANASGSTTST